MEDMVSGKTSSAPKLMMWLGWSAALSTCGCVMVFTGNLAPGVALCLLGAIRAVTVSICRGRELRGRALFDYALRHHRHRFFLILTFVPVFAFLSLVQMRTSGTQLDGFAALLLFAHSVAGALIGLYFVTHVIMIRSVRDEIQEAAAPPEPSRF